MKAGEIMKNNEGKGFAALLCALAVAVVIAVMAPGWMNAEDKKEGTASSNKLDENVATASLNKLFQEGLLLPGATGPISRLIPKADPDKYGVRSLLLIRGLTKDYVQDIIDHGGLWFMEEDGSFAIHPLYYEVDEESHFNIWITKAKLSDVTMENFREVLDLSSSHLMKSGDIEEPTEETETATETETGTETETETESESSKESESSEESKSPSVSENKASGNESESSAGETAAGSTEAPAKL